MLGVCLIITVPYLVSGWWHNYP